MFCVARAKTSGYLETSGEVAEFFLRMISIVWMKARAPNQMFTGSTLIETLY